MANKKYNLLDKLLLPVAVILAIALILERLPGIWIRGNTL